MGGFCMGVGAPKRETADRTRRRRRDYPFNTTKNNVEMFALGDKNERQTVQFFHNFESRSARAPGQKATKGGGDDEKKGPPKTQVLYSVRWIRGPASGSVEPQPGMEDKRSCMALDMGAPNREFCAMGPTNRML